jgi:hypothetical protein
MKLKSNWLATKTDFRARVDWELRATKISVAERRLTRG